ncbi:MAG: GtrA family protein [Phenylobacterium sp.]|uniref:GtrA family protein n=1 Tax=Phenylobacterium sp. TaxID=1871053 RepID=UPI00273543ED|nr:GtrA family protein [Phenylobacterium sp.]MDP1641135.1 GtrA family protein [Phenylobacterium sp.]MDP3116235.1 GtrA family protein [Phenylobacterium sp.]MDP3382829.1 GtrA family protein [Phenylobacterium sp.]
MIQLTSQLLRFGVVAVAGLVVDLGVAMALSTGAGWPLTLAAACGFAAGAGLNYVLNLRWTFRVQGSAGVPGRIAAYALTLGATLLTRLLVVKALEPMAGGSLVGPLGVLVAATGVSFFVNFFLSKRFVFKP